MGVDPLFKGTCSPLTHFEPVTEAQKALALETLSSFSRMPVHDVRLHRAQVGLLATFIAVAIADVHPVQSRPRAQVVSKGGTIEILDHAPLHRRGLIARRHRLFPSASDVA